MTPALLGSLIDHVWQSTLVGAVVWLLTLALKRHAAAIRYRLWMAASLKFVVPFGALAAVGGRLAWRSVPTVLPATWPLVVEEVFSPQASAVAPVAARVVVPHASNVPSALLAVWALGAVAVLFVWWRQWRVVRGALRQAIAAEADLRAAAGVPVLLSANRAEPGLVGIFRPVLLLPRSIREHVPQAGLDAILAHERCHLRRRDNLTAAIHMVVEAIFWFHPGVWWIETRLIEERERACDEAVLLGGAEPRDYAEAILSVCRSYVESSSMAAAGVTGANLKRRIRAIARNEPARPLSRCVAASVAVLAACVALGPVVFGAMTATRSAAAGPVQAVPSGPLSFQAASIKPNKSVQGDRASGFQPGGRFVARNMALRNLIAIAYGEPAPLPLVRVVGGPDWINTERFDIEAKADRDFPETAIRPGFSTTGEQMLRALLAERFKLIAHTEGKEMPVYALVPSRTDRQRPPGLGASSGADCAMPPVPAGGTLPPCGLAFVPDPDANVRHYRARNVTMEELARSFSAFIGTGIDRVIVNQTGLNGGFSFDFQFAPPAAGGSSDFGISIFTAFQEQLGLRLEPTRASVNIVVIDHAERLQDDSAQVASGGPTAPAPPAARPLLSPRPAAAQAAQVGAIAGTVTDSTSNEPLEGVVVEVATEDLPDALRTTTTDASGAFSMDGLAPGIYIVTLHHDEYQTFKREGLRLEAGQTAKMTVAMHFAPIRD